MTRNTLYVRFVDLLNSMNLSEEYERCFLHAIQSGALNIESENDNSYRLPQIILHATLCQLADMVKPSNPENLMESENLQRFM